MTVNTHDTAEITHLYLQRPPKLSHLSLGQWFKAAHKLNDRDLELEVKGQAAKLRMVRMGYTNLPIMRLVEFNNEHKAK